MNSLELLKILQLRFQLRKRYGWRRGQLISYQQSQLNELRQFTYAQSGYYKEFHKGLYKAPLNQLPVLTKRMLMQNWNDVVTDKELHIDDIKSFIERIKLPELFKDKYYINSTSGSSGLKGIFAYNKEEWRNVMTSYSRVYDWAGVKIGIFKHYKVAVVSSLMPWHQSAVVGYTAQSRIMQTLRIDSTQPIDEIVSQLNEFQPEVVIAYANMGKLLALQQINGTLRIQPSSVICASEVLTTHARKLIFKAWNIEPYNTYGATETAGIASETTEHNGLKVFDDLVIVENVDDNYKPVINGKFGTKILVTVLFSRTIPLIRYELDDSICFSEHQEYDRLPFSTIANIQGRQEEIISMKGSNGNITIQPNFFHNLFETTEINEWQVQQEKDNLITVSLVKPVSKVIIDKTRAILLSALLEKEILSPVVDIKEVDKLQKTALGKTFLIKSNETK